jgi:hypothetical protein
MKKVVLVYGVLAGVALIILSIILQMSLGEHSMVTGYVTMVLSLLMVFFGIKSYRDQHNGGVVSFGRAFQVGLYITLIASVFYVVGWEIYSSLHAELHGRLCCEDDLGDESERGLCERDR